MGHVKSDRAAASAKRNRFAIKFAVLRPAIATCITLVAASALPCARAARLAVTIADPAGRAVGDVVITAAPSPARQVSAPVGATAVMDQRNLEFAPQVLVVEVGTSVQFPNNDTVSHQVYSFSPAKRFQLPLYKGEPHRPITFDRPGLVVLGCNIHDTMVGYVYVAGTPYFGKTDPTGALQFKDLPGGEYRVTIWSPFIADPPATLTREIHLESGQSATMQLRLSHRLRAEPEPRPRRRDWEY